MQVVHARSSVRAGTFKSLLARHTDDDGACGIVMVVVVMVVVVTQDGGDGTGGYGGFW